MADEWHQLKVAINLGHLQHERASAKTEASLATSREASARALEEAREADCRREVAEERERELQALNAALEQQVEARRAVLASMRGAPSKEKEILKREEALMLEPSKRSLELERLETRERQVAVAEDAITMHEAKIQEEVDRRVAKAHADLADKHRLAPVFQKAEAKGRITALRTKLDQAEQRERAIVAMQTAAQADLASARADFLSLQQQIDRATSLAKKSADEACRRRTLQREHASMLQDLRMRANRALNTICEESAPHPHEEDYASHLRFFTEIMTRLEDRAARARELIEERSRGLLGRTFSCVFSHLQNLDPHFYFDADIAPMPRVIRDNLLDWVDDHVDALVAEFAPEDDAAVVVVRGGGADDDDEDDASDSSGGDRGKGVPSFDEMMDIALMEVDFDDPTTNVRGRRALAIAKPTPRGY